MAATDRPQTGVACAWYESHRPLAVSQPGGNWTTRTILEDLGLHRSELMYSFDIGLVVSEMLQQRAASLVASKSVRNTGVVEGLRM